MTDNRRIMVSEVGDVTVVRFADRKILDTLAVQELGNELFALVDEENRTNILLNFTGVEFLTSAALSKLITLEKKVRRAGGKLKLSNVRSHIYEVFEITRLNRVFDIRDSDSEALAAF